jgi:hypothetical protein
MTQSRRLFLASATGLALAQMLHAETAQTPANRQHPAKIRRVIQLFVNGGASQMDTLDSEPEYVKQQGELGGRTRRRRRFQGQ